MKRCLAAILVLWSTLSCDTPQDPTAPLAANDIRGVRGAILGNVPRRFVVLGDQEDPADVARDHGLKPDLVFSRVFNGFVASVSDVARDGLLRDARVHRVVPDQVFWTEDYSSPAASWGLDRIDQRTATLDGTYNYVATGKGVTVYIVDTGIRYSHADFAGRASFGFDAFGGSGADCLGHGTHVAGTVGGSVYGVAKDVNLVSVRVMSCMGTGTTASVAAGLEWILANARRPAVINMSVIGDPDDIVDDGVRRLIAAGIPVAAAAGNNNLDACSYSPARVTEAMTIGATSIYDDRAAFSNYGPCVDWYAPGVGIWSDAFGSDTAFAQMSGTSMSTPHTAGAAALYLEANPGASPADVEATLAAWATRSVDTREKGVKSALLLYTLGGGTPTDNLAPKASFTYSCADLACSFTDASNDADGSVTGWTWNFGDGSTANSQNPMHSFAAGGTYSVTLTVTDNGGATGTASAQVSVVSGTQSNALPAARFSVGCIRLLCSFTDSSTDPDGDLVRWEWDYGDGSTSLAVAGVGQSHAFAGGGAYTIQLTVTDNAGATNTSSQQIETGIVVTTVSYRQKGQQLIDLSWKGADSPRVDIYHGTTKLETVGSTPATYAYKTEKHGQSRTYEFRVCEEGSNYCSRTVAVTF
jgi:subtilisin family serine protease